MTLIEFIEELSLTQLHGLAVSNIDDAEKGAHRKKQITLWINKSINKIYREFFMNQKIYSFTKEPDKYEFRMPDDYMSIFGAEVEGDPLYINRDDKKYSIYTPKPFIIDVPSFFDGSEIDIFYAAKAPSVKEDGDIIELEDQYMVALALYVAYLGNELIKGSPNWEHQSFLTKYKKEIADIKSQGYAPTSRIMNYKFMQKGFI